MERLTHILKNSRCVRSFMPQYTPLLLSQKRLSPVTLPGPLEVKTIIVICLLNMGLCFGFYHYSYYEVGRHPSTGEASSSALWGIMVFAVAQMIRLYIPPFQMIPIWVNSGITAQKNEFHNEKEMEHDINTEAYELSIHEGNDELTSCPSGMAHRLCLHAIYVLRILHLGEGA